VGIVLIMISVPLIIACSDDVYVPQYVEDSIVRRDMHRFFLATSILNKSNVPTLEYITGFEFLYDRLRIAWNMLGWGWVVSAVGVTGLLVHYLTLLKEGIALKSPLSAFVVVPALVLLSVCSSSVYAEYLYTRAINAMKYGDYDNALTYLEDSADVDPVRLRSDAFIGRFVESYYWTHDEFHPYSRFYVARQSEADRSREESTLARSMMSELIGVNFSGYSFHESIKRMAVDYYARLLTRDGLIRFGDNKISYARRLWDEAVKVRPETWQAALMSAKASAEIKDYRHCLMYVDRLIEQSSKSAVVADMYSTAGDCYSGMGDVASARQAYMKSNEIDPGSNYRALKELSGT